MKPFFYGAKYLLHYWTAKKPKPLICGLVLHNNCNLNCKHCKIIDRPEYKMSYKEATEVINRFYSKGGRCLYLEGGEPTIWEDHPYTMEDIVSYAQKKGYYSVIIYTNGLSKLNSQANTIFVSVDGLKQTHDELRGTSFDKIMHNIQTSAHPSIYINYTINSVNYTEVEKFCSHISKIPQIKGIFFYLHTPYYGYDHFYLDGYTRNEILHTLIQLKKQYPILNSKAGLRSAIRNDWKKNSSICTVYENGKYYNCCRESMNRKVCKDCGYLSYAEIHETIKLKPGAIINALKYF